MPDDNTPWWEHALNALSAGVSASTQRKQAADAQADAEADQRRRARAKTTNSPAGSFAEAPVRRRRIKPEEPCCDGPRRK